MSELDKLTVRPVWIEWVDSTSSSHWITPSAWIAESTKCITLGFVVWETTDVIVVAASISAIGHVCDPIAIPRCSITKMQEVSWQ